VASSWGYKKAEYNLGVIFANCEGGVGTDLPQALAWMTLAAERRDGSNEHKLYEKGMEKVRSACDDEQIARSKDVLAFLSKTYSDEHALPRAKMRWNSVRMNITGSHIGAVGNLTVAAGGADTSGAKKYAPGYKTGHSSASSLTGGQGTDDSIAYKELRETDNPYDASWDIGTVTVSDVEAVGTKSADGNNT